MKEQLTIVKVSGKIVERAESLRVFIKAFDGIKGRRILIHSGAKMAKQVGDKMSIRTKLVDERPVVDENTLKLLTMVYAGWVNRQLVALLQGRHTNAIGMTGADMNVMTSVRRENGGLGATGDVRQVNAAALTTLLEAGAVPVLSPLTHDGRGNLLFNETDAMAAETAKALALRYDVTLVYCFEKRGVLLNHDDDDSVLAMLRRTQYKAMREMEMIDPWFVNKLDNAFSAIDHGVREVIITNAANLADLNQGTHIK